MEHFAGYSNLRLARVADSIQDAERFVLGLAHELSIGLFTVAMTLEDNEPLADPTLLNCVQAPDWLKARWAKSTGPTRGRRALHDAIDVFANPKSLQFASLSHSSDGLNLAIAFSPMGDPVVGIGIDIEPYQESDGSPREMSPKLQSRVLNRMGRPSVDSLEFGIFELWTLGEALYKSDPRSNEHRLWPSPVTQDTDGRYDCDFMGLEFVGRVAAYQSYLIAVAIALDYR